MSGEGKRDERFAVYQSRDDSPPKAPDYLEIVETGPGGTPKNRLKGGAYDPYQKLDAGSPGDTARTRRPRVDLRKLSEWIETTQRVKTLREEELRAQQEPRRGISRLLGFLRRKKK